MVSAQHLSQVDTGTIHVKRHAMVGEREVRNRDQPPAGLNRELLLRGEPGTLQQQQTAMFERRADARLERGPPRPGVIDVDGVQAGG
jgi:hypothetical protein